MRLLGAFILAYDLLLWGVLLYGWGRE